MPLNKAEGDMYPFIDYTWNPIKGACPHNCSYCYVKRIYKRFKKEQPAPYLDEKEMKVNFGTGKFIFVGSSIDMFADCIAEDDIRVVIKKCKSASESKFLFQSKNPGRLVSFEKEFGDNSVFCTTIESNIGCYVIGPCAPPLVRAFYFRKLNRPKMLTIEPVIRFDRDRFLEIIKSCGSLRQVNIGADSGRNNLLEPSREDVLWLIDELRKFTKVVCKKNLKRIIGEERC
jgi:hypothetical protein